MPVHFDAIMKAVICMKPEAVNNHEHFEGDRSPVGNYEVLTPNNFLADVAREAKAAKKRLWIQTMYMEPGIVSARLTNILKDAAARNLDTKLHVDWFGLVTTNGELVYSAGFPLFPIGTASANIIRQKKQWFKTLQDSGVDVFFTNPPRGMSRILPYRGRNHMKITIVDNISYLGGLNIADRDFTYADFMVKITDEEITRAIAKQFSKVHDDNLEDEDILIDDTRLFVDSGKTDDSVILARAIDAVQGAESSVYHTSQFIPDGRFLKALHDAYTRGLDVQTIVPEQNTFNRLFAIIYRMNQLSMYMKGQRIPLLFYPTMLHAKLVIVDEKLAIFGSHNLSDKGVKMGTAEIALHSTNETLVKHLLDFYKILTRGSTSTRRP